MPDKKIDHPAFSASVDRFLADESGATAIEYALIASLLSIAVVGSAFLLGGGLSNIWDYVLAEVMAGVAP